MFNQYISKYQPFIYTPVLIPVWNLSTGYISDYRKGSNISRTLVGNKIVDHLDVVGALPVGTAPTTSSFST